MKVIDIWCSAAIVLGLCILPIIIILGIIVYRDNKEERNHNKRCDDDLDYPDVPDYLYHKRVVEEIDKIIKKTNTIGDLRHLSINIKDYVIPNSKSDDKPNDV